LRIIPKQDSTSTPILKMQALKKYNSSTTTKKVDGGRKSRRMVMCFLIMKQCYWNSNLNSSTKKNTLSSSFPKIKRHKRK